MSTDAGNTFIEKNSGYNVTQFYSTALHPAADEYYFLAGAQDNGTQQFTDASGIVSTYEVTGGDGAYYFIDQTDPNYQITSYIYNNYRISSDGGNNFTYLEDDYTGRFINPADYDDEADILYSAMNADSIKRIHDRSTSYYSDYMSVALGATASHIRASDYTTNVIYVGTSSGRLYKIINANSSGPSSIEITGSSFPTAWISCIELGSSDNEILVTFSNFGVTSIWYTIDGGMNWINKEGDLPDMPVRWALFNPENRSEVILATDIGVWSTNDLSISSPAWVASNSGLANVRVDMLQIRDSDGLVTAATYGRGLFSTDDFATSDLLYANDYTLPMEFTLHQNYPNPLNPNTQIRYDLPKSEYVSINIYDVIGHKIKSLINMNQDAGYRIISWDATNDLGQSVSAGMYIYTIQAGEFRQTRKMVLLK